MDLFQVSTDFWIRQLNGSNLSKDEPKNKEKKHLRRENLETSEGSAPREVPIPEEDPTHVPNNPKPEIYIPDTEPTIPQPEPIQPQPNPAPEPDTNPLKNG